MAKEKTKGPRAPPNKHLVARTAFLQRAAACAASQQDIKGLADTDTPTSPSLAAATKLRDSKSTSSNRDGPPVQQARLGGVPYILSTQLRQVALRSQTRLLSEVKRKICKVCNSVLIDGRTCVQFVENLSRYSGKAHADVLVIECLACGNRKHIPTGAARQRSKNKRGHAQAHENTPSTDYRLNVPGNGLQKLCTSSRPSA